MSSEVTSLGHRVTLGDGNKMPIFGLGSWKMLDEQATYDAVMCAVKEGYRMFDTAQVYGNEATVGKALRERSVVLSSKDGLLLRICTR